MAKHPATAQQGTHVLIKSSFAHSVFYPKRMCLLFLAMEHRQCQGQLPVLNLVFHAQPEAFSMLPCHVGKVYIVCFCVSKVETQDRVPQERSKRNLSTVGLAQCVTHVTHCDRNLVAVHGQETLPRPVDAINSDIPTKQDQTFMVHRLANKVIYFSDWKHRNKLCTESCKSWM